MWIICFLFWHFAEFDTLFEFQIGPLDTEKETILSENRSLAEMNLAKEPKLLELKGIISELSEEGKTLCSSVQEKLTEISKFAFCNYPKIQTNIKNRTCWVKLLLPRSGMILV